eukprot:scaffold391054_cov29-Prasinocladus_malaysianus.AAC.1
MRLGIRTRALQASTNMCPYEQDPWPELRGYDFCKELFYRAKYHEAIINVFTVTASDCCNQWQLSNQQTNATLNLWRLAPLKQPGQLNVGMWWASPNST